MACDSPWPSDDIYANVYCPLGRPYERSLAAVVRGPGSCLRCPGGWQKRGRRVSRSVDKSVRVMTVNYKLIADWLTHWLFFDWLTDFLIDWFFLLIIWLVVFVTDWSTDFLIGFVSDRWLTNWLTDGMFDSVFELVVIWLIVWMTYWLKAFIWRHQDVDLVHKKSKKSKKYFSRWPGCSSTQ